MTKEKKPLILVVNDDGYHAKGIKSLVEVISDFGEVLVVSPAKPQSGMGHAITVSDILRLTKISDFGNIEAYSCSGTPVDCVKLAIYTVLKRKPDLIVSGINHGGNYSISVLYSGTMSAAVEGAIEGVPSIGFSLNDHSLEADFEASKRIVRAVVGKALKNKLAENICLNVNIPALKYDQIKGIKVCRQGMGNWEDNFEDLRDPSGLPYYWLAGKFQNLDKGEDTDIWAIENGYVSVVPVQYDMTAHQAIAGINNWELEK
ncbi:MAG: 5'-nucleotidase [Patiriisocius sp.]|jgi:5'-nucleotidase